MSNQNTVISVMTSDKSISNALCSHLQITVDSVVYSGPVPVMCTEEIIRRAAKGWTSPFIVIGVPEITSWAIFNVWLGSCPPQIKGRSFDLVISDYHSGHSHEALKKIIAAYLLWSNSKVSVFQSEPSPQDVVYNSANQQNNQVPNQKKKKVKIAENQQAQSNTSSPVTESKKSNLKALSEFPENQRNKKGYWYAVMKEIADGKSGLKDIPWKGVDKTKFKQWLEKTWLTSPDAAKALKAADLVKNVEKTLDALSD